MTHPSWVDAYAATLPLTGRRVLFAGNSLTAGTGASDPATTAYPARVLTRLGAPWTGVNCGVGGQTTGDIITAIKTQLWDNIRAADVTARLVVVVWEGSNDICNVHGGSTTVQACWDRTVTLCGMIRRWNGAKIILPDIITRRNVGWDDETYNAFTANSAAYNALHAAHWGEIADARVVLSTDPDIGVPGAWSDPLFFGDQVHLTDDGYDYLSTLIEPAIAAYT